MDDKPISQQIDDIIRQYSGWKGETLAHLRKIILAAHPDVVEEVKWKMTSRPLGWPVWSHQGIICFAEVWKDNVKLIFTKGIYLKDPKKLFNARLMSSKDRAIELKEGDKIDEPALKGLVLEAMELNKAGKSKK